VRATANAPPVARVELNRLNRALVQQPGRLSCDQCGRASDLDACGWAAFVGGDPDGLESTNLVVFCPTCATTEFGYVAPRRGSMIIADVLVEHGDVELLIAMLRHELYNATADVLANLLRDGRRIANLSTRQRDEILDVLADEHPPGGLAPLRSSLLSEYAWRRRGA
jgi:hypothetical protein